MWTYWGAQQFGQIRLGGEGGGAFDAERPWVKWPVAAVAGVVAVVSAVPMVVGSFWRGVNGLFGGGRRYTTRQSFARGRQGYAVVDPDEDELLGEAEEDEV